MRHRSQGKPIAGRPARLGTAALLALVGFAWIGLCDLALDPLRDQLEASRIRQAGVLVRADTPNVVEFAETSKAGIEHHSPGSSQLYARLADFCRHASATVSDPASRLLLAEEALRLRLEAARCEPTSARHSFRAAVDSLRLCRDDVARLEAERACRLLPHDPWIRARLAEVFCAWREPQLAAHYLQDAETLASDEAIPQAQLAIARARQRLDSASSP